MIELTHSSRCPEDCVACALKTIWANLPMTMRNESSNPSRRALEFVAKEYDEQRRYLSDATGRWFFGTEAPLAASRALSGAPGPEELQFAREQLDSALDFMSHVKDLPPNTAITVEERAHLEHGCAFARVFLDCYGAFGAQEEWRDAEKIRKPTVCNCRPFTEKFKAGGSHEDWCPLYHRPPISNKVERPLPEVGSWWRHRNVSPQPPGVRQAVRRVTALLPHDGKVFVRFHEGPQFDVAIMADFWEPWQPRAGEIVSLRRGAGVPFEVVRLAESPVFRFQLDDGSCRMASELNFLAHSKKSEP